MQCVTTASYSILINGEPTQAFKPRCGLRQGDPISPYLFILVLEVLSKLMLRLEQAGHVKGVKISRSTPSISHLIFADDSLFCSKPIQYHVVKLEKLKIYSVMLLVKPLILKI